MNAVTATRRTLRREWTSFGVLLIISVGLMGISDTSTVHDLQSGVYTVAGPIMTVVNEAGDTAGSYWSALTQIDRLRSQNEQLKQENLTLQEELNRMGAISKLNDDWTKITAAQGSVPYETTPVRVIVRDLLRQANAEASPAVEKAKPSRRASAPAPIMKRARGSSSR